jgi:hypothetical protein
MFNISEAQTYKKNLSKWNKKRSVRARTLYIILHTTEGNDESAINTIKRYGTANYVVKTNGVIEIIIEDRRVAKHAGRSMWYGTKNLSNVSVGIEVVGYHSKKPTVKQIEALKKLLTVLKAKYKLPNTKVLTHSMVAFDKPNKWHKKNHRGRKRCGMLFATEGVRKSLGLGNTFAVDPDIKAKRLVNADSYLASILYGKKKFEEEEEEKEAHPINEKKDDNDDEFEGFRTLDSTGVYGIAGEEYNASTTLYFLPDGKIRTGKEFKESEFSNLPKGTKVLVGYVYGGKVTKSRTAYSIVGKDYNLPSTFYRLPDGKILTGDDVNGNLIPIGTIVLFRD